MGDADPSADVLADGSIRPMAGLLGGGNNVGGNANASVFATWICEAAAPTELITDSTVSS
jgi:hypothetical protein